MRLKRQSFLERDVNNQWHILQPNYSLGKGEGERNLDVSMSTVCHVQHFMPLSQKGAARALIVPIKQARSLRLKEVELPKEAMADQAGLRWPCGLRRLGSVKNKKSREGACGILAFLRSTWLHFSYFSQTFWKLWEASAPTVPGAASIAARSGSLPASWLRPGGGLGRRQLQALWRVWKTVLARKELKAGAVWVALSDPLPTG